MCCLQGFRSYDYSTGIRGVERGLGLGVRESPTGLTSVLAKTDLHLTTANGE